MKVKIASALAAMGAALPAVAANMSVKVEIPRLNVAEYHRPYVAFWIEKADQGFVSNLAVWYDLKMRNNEGTKWLKDMRSWWRKSGRELNMPVDGISGATRAVGEHTVNFGAKNEFSKLQPGAYQLVVEAAREVGGREMVKVPFDWPPASLVTSKATGTHELGAVSVTLNP